MDTQQGGHFLDRAAVAVDERPRVVELGAVRAVRGPNFTPRALAASRPLRVRSMIRARSNSARPANTVRTMRLAGLVVVGPRLG